MLVGPPFDELQRHQVSWEYRITPSRLVDLVASRSCTITLPALQRVALLTDVRRLTGTHPDPVGRAEIAVPYVTRCHRTELSPGTP